MYRQRKDLNDGSEGDVSKVESSSNSEVKGVAEELENQSTDSNPDDRGASPTTSPAPPTGTDVVSSTKTTSLVESKRPDEVSESSNPIEILAQIFPSRFVTVQVHHWPHKQLTYLDLQSQEFFGAGAQGMQRRSSQSSGSLCQEECGRQVDSNLPAPPVGSQRCQRQRQRQLQEPH